jgi:hypothetical protein
MIKFRFVFCTLYLVTIVCGCASYTTLTKGQKKIDLPEKSYALLSVRISNQNKPDYQLEILGTYVCPPSENCAESKTRKYLYRADDWPYKRENLFNESLLSFELESGTYNIAALDTYAKSFFSMSLGRVLLNLKTEIKPNSVIYLGHLDIVLRERKRVDEQPAGDLLDHGDTVGFGYWSGTFDVVVKDRFDEDIKLFTSEYPALKKVKIEKSILPQWIRPENQKTN